MITIHLDIKEMDVSLTQSAARHLLKDLIVALGECGQVAAATLAKNHEPRPR